jgi:ClpP class serine protease
MPAQPSFEIRAEPCGQIGVLSIDREITRALLPDLQALEAAIPEISGLFVFYCSGGGAIDISDRLELAILRAKKHFPVVSFIEKAQSSAQLTCLAADRIFADGGGLLGGYGVATYFCDGRRPQVTMSRQSPAKWPDPPSYPPAHYWSATEEELRERQAAVDAQFEDDLKVIAGYRKVPAESLRPVMDGRDILPRAAQRLGLVDEIVQTELEAYAYLIDLIKIKKEEDREMELLAKFFKSVKKQDPVDAAIQAVADLEAKRDKRTVELAKVKEELQAKFEETILAGAEPGDQAALSARIVEIQAELEAFAALIKKARLEASRIISSQKEWRRTRIEELGDQIRELRAEQDRERMRETALFIRKHGGTVSFPSRNMGGSVGIPSVVIPEEEIRSIFDEVALEPRSVERQVDIEGLQRELNKLQILERTGVHEVAISTLVAEVKRAA